MKYSETEIIKHLEIEIDSAEHINMHYGGCINTEIIKENIALINRQQKEIRQKVEYIQEQRDIIDELKAEKEEILKQLEKMKSKPIELIYDVPLIDSIITIVKNGGK